LLVAIVIIKVNVAFGEIDRYHFFVRDRILLELKLGRQASAYKAAQKALNRFIQEIKLMVNSF
jgi:hypothetical protein